MQPDADAHPAAFLSESDARLLRNCIDDLTELALMYERRLIFKGRYRYAAQMAASSRRVALRAIERLTG